jgi:hypothetical protein
MNESIERSTKKINVGRFIRFIFLFILIPASFAAIVYGIQSHTIFVSEPEAVFLHEPAVIFDTTFDGISRIDFYTFKRTYSGEPPSLLCPT